MKNNSAFLSLCAALLVGGSALPALAEPQAHMTTPVQTQEEADVVETITLRTERAPAVPVSHGKKLTLKKLHTITFTAGNDAIAIDVSNTDEGLPSELHHTGTGDLKILMDGSETKGIEANGKSKLEFGPSVTIKPQEGDLVNAANTWGIVSYQSGYDIPNILFKKDLTISQTWGIHNEGFFTVQGDTNISARTRAISTFRAGSVTLGNTKLNTFTGRAIEATHEHSQNKVWAPAKVTIKGTLDSTGQIYAQKNAVITLQGDSTLKPNPENDDWLILADGEEAFIRIKPAEKEAAKKINLSD